jgi:signal transduction histidine kinase
VLLGACGIVGAVVLFQLALVVLQPGWAKVATDWQREVSAVIELGLVVYVSRTLSQQHVPGALTWWMMSLALACYVIARTLWLVNDLYAYPAGVPFPSIPQDLFFVLQYPLFFAAVLCLPRFRPWVLRLRVILDSLLWIATATTLSWFFLLNRALTISSGALGGKIVTVVYPIGDLVLFSGLAVALSRTSWSKGAQLGTYALMAAFVSLFAADFWVGEQLLVSTRPAYTTGGPPDLFWTACYALIALAAAVQLRFARLLPTPRPAPARPVLSWRDVIISVRSLLPFAVTLAAASAILLNVAATGDHGPGWVPPITPIVMSLGLLALATVRQVVVLLDYELMRREQEQARAHEAILQASNRRMEEFLEVASHELKTPLTSLDGNVQLMARRLDALALQPAETVDCAGTVSKVRILVERCEPSLNRLGRLVNDLLDESTMREDGLELRTEPCDFTAVVVRAVEDARLVHPNRTIRLLADQLRPIPVFGDPERLLQALSHYVGNALKFSRADQVVSVRIEPHSTFVRISVHDDGPAIPLDEQGLIWERYHRASGVAVQCGSGIGLGLGLSVTRAIVERHGGRVGVISAPDDGCTFWLTVPVAAGDAAPAPAV